MLRKEVVPCPLSIRGPMFSETVSERLRHGVRWRARGRDERDVLFGCVGGAYRYSPINIEIDVRYQYAVR